MSRLSDVRNAGEQELKIKDYPKVKIMDTISVCECECRFRGWGSAYRRPS